jgi:hypothetical protein
MFLHCHGCPSGAFISNFEISISHLGPQADKAP